MICRRRHDEPYRARREDRGTQMRIAPQGTERMIEVLVEYGNQLEPEECLQAREDHARFLEDLLYLVLE
jgi:hypothetical protein